MKNVLNRIATSIKANKEDGKDFGPVSTLNWVESGMVWDHNLHQRDMFGRACFAMVKQIGETRHELPPLRAVVEKHAGLMEVKADASYEEIAFLNKLLCEVQNKPHPKSWDELPVAANVGIFNFRVESDEVLKMQEKMAIHIKNMKEVERKLLSDVNKEKRSGKEVSLERNGQEYPANVVTAFSMGKALDAAIKAANEEYVTHTVRTKDDLESHMIKDATKRDIHWAALYFAFYAMEQEIKSFLQENDNMGVMQDYLFPKGMVENKIGRVKMGPLLSSWFWLSVAAKNHKPAEEGEFDTAGWLDSQRAKMNHKLAQLDDEQYEGGHYEMEGEAALIEKEARHELQGRLVPLHEKVWPIIERINMVTTFGDEFWDNTFQDMTEYPVQDLKRSERGIGEALGRMEELKHLPAETMSLFAELMAQA